VQLDDLSLMPNALRETNQVSYIVLIPPVWIVGILENR
jgi:hypothetical protein